MYVVVREGTQAAEGVSQHDLNLRKQLSRFKKGSLKDLTMFISPTRLCVHNVPFSMEDPELKAVFKQYAPKGAVVNEVREEFSFFVCPYVYHL
jgi:nucleolar protein 4